METETPVQVKVLPRGEMLKARLASAEAVSKMSEEDFNKMLHEQLTSSGYMLDPSDPKKLKYIPTPETKAAQDIRAKEFEEERKKRFAERFKKE